MSLARKLKKLKKIILNSKSAAIAYSAGADSTLLLYIASKLLPKNNIIAVTANSALYPKRELSSAEKIAESFEVRHKVVIIQQLKRKVFSSNQVNRCYFCKKELFAALKKIARQHKLNNVFDASNLSDKKDFRPGERAKKELGVRSPLQEAGINKKEVRELSRLLKLKTWDKPSSPCLASRIPYGTGITVDILKRIDYAEEALNKMGFKQARLRHYGRMCRLEVLKQDIPGLVLAKKRVVDKLKKLGYNYVTVDLEGYRTGSMNEMLKI